MIGNGYWATGITVRYDPDLGWTAWADFYDDGFAEQDSTEGRVKARYWSKDTSVEALARQIDLVKADVERLGITFKDAGEQRPSLYIYADGEEEWSAPKDWRALLADQSERLGWDWPYPAERS
jgi:hypothetical protein